MNTLRIFLRELRTRWLAATITVVVIFLMLLMMMAVLDTMDLSVLDAYPKAMRQMMGVPDGASAETFAYGSTLTLMGGLALAGVAVAIGADTVAGEERRRTLASLLGNPVGRRGTLVAKRLAFLTIIALSALVLCATTLLGNQLLDVDPGEARLLELCVAIGANALFHGALAFAVGAISGDKGLAAGIGGGVLAIGWLASSILPMVPEYADSAKYIPYGWFTEPNVLMEGLDTNYLVLQVVLAVVLVNVGTEWFVRRDLRSISPKSLSERLAALPLAGRLASGGTRRPASLFGLSFGRSATLLWVVCAVMAVFTMLMGPVWDQVEGDVGAMVAGMPEGLTKLFGAGDMSTPTGFLWGEMFGLMAPAAVIIIGAVVASGLASEEASGRLGLILSHPVKRSRAVGTAITTMAVQIAIVVSVQGAATWGTTAVSTLDILVDNIVGATAHLLALGLCIGGIAMLVAAATGSSKAAVWTATAVGVIGHFSHSALSLGDETQAWSKLSPFHYYGSVEPLANGANWGHVGILLAIAVIALAVAFPLYQRRDLRV